MSVRGDLLYLGTQSGGGTDTFVRPNLLDNWYFVGGGSQQGGGQFPINQRGETSYSTVNYAIDRWRTWDDTENNTWIQLTSDGVRISRTLYQYKQPIFFEGIYGKTVTLSILFADGELYSGSHQLISNDWFSTIVNHGNINMLQIGISNADFSNMNDNFFRVICINSGTLSSSIEAVKFELGDTQTLAHQDENGNWVLNEIPNYQQELAKCQMYYQIYRTQSLRPTYAADCRPVMRTDPVQSTITVDGTTYYVNGADL